MRLLDERHELDVDAFATLRIWQVPRSVRGSAHDYKYSLALVIGNDCVMRFDNEAGKDDHLHRGTNEVSYSFTGVSQLIADFWLEVDRWLVKKTR